MALIKERIAGAIGLWPSVARVLRLVWQAAPSWTAIWLILLVVQGLLPVATVYLTKYLVDSLVALIESGLEPDLLWPALTAIAGMLLVMLVSEMLRSFTNMVYTAQSDLVSDYVRDLVLVKAAQVDIAYYDSPAYFDRLHRASVEAHYRPVSLVRGMGSVLQNLITLVAMAGVLLQFGVVLPLALIISSFPALYVVLHHRMAAFEWRMRNTATVRRSWYYEWLQTNRRAVPEVRLFALSDYFRDQFQQIRNRLRQEQLELVKKQGGAELAAGILGLLVLGLALAWMLWQTIQGNISLGDLALFYQAFSTGQGLMRSLLNNMGEIYSNGLFLTDLFEYLDLEGTISDPDQPQAPPVRIQQGISFENVAFSYPDSERAVLTDFNMSIAAGQFTAIVGRNGAGKSTLVKLLTRIYDVHDGKISIDGIDIREFRQRDLHRLVTTLFQTPVDFNDTVADNIAFGDIENANRQSIVAAAYEAGADEIIERLPQKYETILGRRFEGGTDLSVGEWQRLALARAFLRDAPIIILDEPTSAMDPWAEAEWLRRFRSIDRDYTIILITHRLSTAMYAEKIFLMDEGQIVESGSHDELLSLGGRYAQSWYATERPGERR